MLNKHAAAEEGGDEDDGDLLSDSDDEPAAEAARPAPKTAKPRARLPDSSDDDNVQPAADSSDEEYK